MVGVTGTEGTQEREAVEAGEETGGREWLDAAAGDGARFHRCDRILAACSSFARLRDHCVARVGVSLDVPAGVKVSESDISAQKTCRSRPKVNYSSQLTPSKKALLRLRATR